MYANFYLLLKFLHITAAIGMFACWGIEWISLSLQNERNQIDNAISGNLKNVARLQTVAVIMLIGTGIWMSITTWGFLIWIASAIITIVIMEVLASLLPRYAVSWKLDRKNSEDNASAMHQSLMKSVLQIKTVLGIGIIALMTLKPQTILQCTSIVAASVLAGGIWALTTIKKQAVHRS